MGSCASGMIITGQISMSVPSTISWEVNTPRPFKALGAKKICGSFCKIGKLFLLSVICYLGIKKLIPHSPPTTPGKPINLSTLLLTKRFYRSNTSRLRRQSRCVRLSIRWLKRHRAWKSASRIICFYPNVLPSKALKLCVQSQ